MAFCANCGAALTQNVGFCGSCGKPVGMAAPATVSTGQPTAQPTLLPNAAPSSASGLTSNIAGALAYVLGLITGIIFLVIEPYKHDRFVRFHAMQSILLSAAFIVISIAWNIVTGFLLDITGWIALVILPISLVFSLGMFLLWLYVMYQAYSQREYHIPFIGNLAAKQVG